MFHLNLTWLKGACGGEYVDVRSMLEYPSLAEAIRVAEDIAHIFMCDIHVMQWQDGLEVVIACVGTGYTPGRTYKEER